MGLIGCLRLLLIRSLGFRAKVIGSRAQGFGRFGFQVSKDRAVQQVL